MPYRISGNFHSAKLSQLHNFEDFLQLWGKSNLLFFSLKCSSWRAVPVVFMFIMYHGCLVKERYFIALAKPLMESCFAMCTVC